MATAKLYNLARMTTATTGTGTITLGSAATGFLSFAGAGVQDAEVVTYAIEDGSDREIGRGTYTSSGTTLTRTVLKSTNSDNAIDLSGTAEVFICDSAEDHIAGPSTSVDSEIALFSGTGGATLKRASTTGILKASSGVIAAAVAGTDYVAPAGALGTPASGTLTNCTGLPQAGTVGLTTGDSPHFAAVNVGNASDTTVARQRAGVIEVEGFAIPRVLSVQNTGNTNDSSSGSGSDFDHNLTYTLAANELASAKALRISAQFSLSTGTPANLTMKLKAGSTTLYSTTATAPTSSAGGLNMMLTFYVQAAAAPGASVNVFTGGNSNVSAAWGSANANQVSQPVALATNGTLQFKMSTLWSAAGTGTNTITLNQFIVEAVN